MSYDASITRSSIEGAFATTTELLDHLIEFFGEQFPDRDLYSISTDWVEDRSFSTIKLRGTRGDLLVQVYD